MTSEQVKELAEALSILSAKSSVLKERKELRDLMDENLQAEEVRTLAPLQMLTYSRWSVSGSAIAFRRTH